MNDAVQLSADIFHIPNSGKNLCLRRFAAVKIRRHIVQVTILFGPQAFPNGVLIGKSIAVIHLIPITICCRDDDLWRPAPCDVERLSVDRRGGKPSAKGGRGEQGLCKAHPPVRQAGEFLLLRPALLQCGPIGGYDPILHSLSFDDGICSQSAGEHISSTD